MNAIIRVILIDGPSKLIHEYEIPPSHLAIEEAIGTRFWAKRKLENGDTLYYQNEFDPSAQTLYFFEGMGYVGSGLIARLDRYFDLESAVTPLEDAAAVTHFTDAS